jgi:cytochrome c1
MKTGLFGSFLAVLLAMANAFLAKSPSPRSWGRLAMAADPFELEVSIPPSGSDIVAKMKFYPILSVPSEIVEVRYKLPFGLDVAPKNNMAICTKDGAGGEKKGDVLRFTSQWTLGLPRGDGLATTAASFAGGLSWQCSMFDVMKASRWEQVVEALTSNVESRTDEVVLIFERALETDA